MTREEATEVAKIVILAHGECSHCAGWLIYRCVVTWPEHRDIFIHVYNERFDGDIEKHIDNEMDDW